MTVIYKREPVTLVNLTVVKSEYVNKPLINQVQIKYKDGSTDYVNSEDVVWEVSQNKSYE